MSHVTIGGYNEILVRNLLTYQTNTSFVSNLTSQDVQNMIKWVPISSEYYWSAALGTLLSGNTTIKIITKSVVINSTSNFNVLPAADYASVMKVIQKGHLCQNSTSN